MKTKTSADIILLGLGPGDPTHLTQEAWQLLHEISELYLRTCQHPVVNRLPAQVKLQSFDDLYDQAETFEQVYEQIVERIIALGQRPEGVVYGVPGHPLIAEATSPEIVRRARSLGLAVRVVDGMSFIEPTLTALNLDLFPRSSVVDALEIVTNHHPVFPPDAPALIAQVHATAVAANLKLTLMATYPDEHRVYYVHAAGTDACHVESLPLFEIDRSPYLGLLSSLYVPPLGPATSFEAFQELIAHLRSPDGCPWDRAQTHLSLRPFLLEETYEALDALDSENPQALREELGDLLIQIVLHAQIAAELGEFTMAEVLRHVHQKLIDRHPHVFGELTVDGVAAVKDNWERLKIEARQAEGRQAPSVLDGVASTMPALGQADAYQKRAARVGFDWPSVAAVYTKVEEELSEVLAASDPQVRAAEIGDLLFSVVNLARWYDIDAESVLREANARFRRRFIAMEQKARLTGRVLADLTLEEMDSLWEAVKNQE